jgi:hypothetical protein
LRQVQFFLLSAAMAGMPTPAGAQHSDVPPLALGAGLGIAYSPAPSVGRGGGGLVGLATDVRVAVPVRRLPVANDAIDERMDATLVAAQELAVPLLAALARPGHEFLVGQVGAIGRGAHDG